MAETVQVSYRLSAKVDPTNRDSAWHSAEVTYGTEVDGATINMEDVAEELLGKTKIQVFTQLGYTFTEDANGAIQPVFPVTAIPTRSQSRREDVELPGVTIDGKYYYDYRDSPQKTKNPRFPDFKAKDGSESHWLLDRDGGKSEFAVKLEAAGIV